MFAPIGAAISWVGSTLSEFGINLFDVGKIADRSTSRIDAITNSVRKLVKWVGLGISSIAMLIPGLQMVGLVGVAGFGGSLIGDAVGGGTSSGAGRRAPSSSFVSSGFGAPSISTQMDSPTPRAMNLEHREDAVDVLKNILKENKKSNTMTETQTEQEKILRSQHNAGGTLWRR